MCCTIPTYRIDNKNRPFGGGPCENPIGGSPPESVPVVGRLVKRARAFRGAAAAHVVPADAAQLYCESAAGFINRPRPPLGARRIRHP